MLLNPPAIGADETISDPAIWSGADVIEIRSDSELASLIINNSWSGNGSEVNPYIIENLTIDAEGADHCMSIMNTTSYLVIRNCTFTNATARYALKDEIGRGVIIENSKNIDLDTIQISHCSIGLVVSNSSWINVSILESRYNNHSVRINSSSSYVKIISSSFNPEEVGLRVSSSSNIRIEDCDVTSAQCGIEIIDSRICYLYWNSIERSEQWGIKVEGSYDQGIIGNHLYFTGNGIKVEGCRNSYIVNNDVRGTPSDINGLQGIGSLIDRSEDILLQYNDYYYLNNSIQVINCSEIEIDHNDMRNSYQHQVLKDSNDVSLMDCIMELSSYGVMVDNCSGMNIETVTMDDIDRNSLTLIDSRDIDLKKLSLYSSESETGILMKRVSNFTMDESLIEIHDLVLRIEDCFHGFVYRSTFRGFNNDAVFVNRSVNITFELNYFQAFYPNGPDYGYGLNFGPGCSKITLNGNTINGLGLKLFQDYGNTTYVRHFLDTLEMHIDNQIGSSGIKFLKDTDYENNTIRDTVSLVLIYNSRNVKIDLDYSSFFQTTYLSVDSENIQVFRTTTEISSPGAVFINSSRVSISYATFNYCQTAVFLKDCDTVFFRSNVFQGFGRSIRIENTTRINVMECSFHSSPFQGSGLEISGSGLINISLSTFDYTTDPMVIMDTRNLEISSNLFTNNSGPVILDHCKGLSFHNNSFKDQEYGIKDIESMDAVFHNNDLHVSFISMEFYGSSKMEFMSNLYEMAQWALLFDGAMNINIKENIFLKNDNALHIEDSGFFDINDNLFLENDLEAIQIHRSNIASIFNNSFIWNNDITNEPVQERSQVEQLGCHNILWSSEDHGNHWSEHIEPDPDLDGIIDVPYVIQRDGEWDNRPLRFSPYRMLSEPREIECDPGSQSVHLSWEAPLFDIGGGPTGYSVYRGRDPEKLDLLERTVTNDTEYHDSSGESGIIYHYAVRGLNKYGEGYLSDIVSGYKDNTPPSIDFLNPTKGIWINTSYIDVEWDYTEDESELMGFEIQLDEEGWVDAGNLTSFFFMDLDEGYHVVEIKVSNSLGLTEKVRCEFFVDTIKPELMIGEGRTAYTKERVISLYWDVREHGSGLIGYRSRTKGENWSEIFNSDNIMLELERERTEYQVMAIDKAGNSRIETIDIYFDDIPPIFVMKYPDENLYINNTEIRVRWKFKDAGVGIDHYRIQGPGLDKLLDPRIEEYVFDSLTEGSYKVIIFARDLAGNQNSTMVKFEVDTTPPQLLRYGPIGDDVDVDSDIWVTFSEYVQLGTLVLRIEGVTGSLSDTDTGKLLSPDEILEYGRTYYVEVMGFDLAGNVFGPFSWSFKTPNLGYIVGRIVDDKGRAIEGAEVSAGDYAITLTNEDGRFYLTLPPGPYVVTVRKGGYDDREMELFIDPGSTIDIEDVRLKDQRNLSDNLLLILIALFILLIMIISISFILIRRRKRGRSVEEFYILEDPPYDPPRIENDEDDFEIEYFDGSPNFYQLLEVPDNATSGEIKRSYRKLAAMYHPDRMAARGEEMELDEIADLMRDINEAKAVLLDPLRRQMYDMSLLEQEM